MTSPTAQFLEDLGRRGYLKPFENIQGRLRLDLTGDGGSDTWLVVVDRGKVQVSHGSQDADCVIRAERAFFDRVASGEANALSALLRGLIQIEGNLQLALVLGRALPGRLIASWMPVFMPWPPAGLWMCTASPARNTGPDRYRVAPRRWIGAPRSHLVKDRDTFREAIKAVPVVSAGHGLDRAARPKGLEPLTF